MCRSYTLSPSVTSRVPHGSLDVGARLGFRRTRPRSTLQVLPAQRFVGGTLYPRPAKAGRQEPREPLSPRAILVPLAPTMLCAPAGHVGESSPRHGEATTPEGDGFYSSPTPPRFYKYSPLRCTLGDRSELNWRASSSVLSAERGAFLLFNWVNWLSLSKPTLLRYAFTLAFPSTSSGNSTALYDPQNGGYVDYTQSQTTRRHK